jgi:hypothetical protein
MVLYDLILLTKTFFLGLSIYCLIKICKKQNIKYKDSDNESQSDDNESLTDDDNESLTDDNEIQNDDNNEIQSDDNESLTDDNNESQSDDNESLTDDDNESLTDDKKNQFDNDIIDELIDNENDEDIINIIMKKHRLENKNILDDIKDTQIKLAKDIITDKLTERVSEFSQLAHQLLLKKHPQNENIQTIVNNLFSKVNTIIDNIDEMND